VFLQAYENTYKVEKEKLSVATVFNDPFQEMTCMKGET